MTHPRLTQVWNTVLALAALLAALGAATQVWHGAPPDTLAPHHAARENAQIFVAAALGARPDFLPEHLTTQTAPERFRVSGLFRDPAQTARLQRYEVELQHLGAGAWERLRMDIAPLR